MDSQWSDGGRVRYLEHVRHRLGERRGVLSRVEQWSAPIERRRLHRQYRHGDLEHGHHRSQPLLQHERVRRHRQHDHVDGNGAWHLDIRRSDEHCCVQTCGIGRPQEVGNWNSDSHWRVNTYSGGTSIAGGTLQIGNGGTTGQLGTGNVLNDGTLVVNRSNALTVSQVISGTGAVTQAGAGATTWE